MGYSLLFIIDWYLGIFLKSLVCFCYYKTVPKLLSSYMLTYLFVLLIRWIPSKSIPGLMKMWGADIIVTQLHIHEGWSQQDERVRSEFWHQDTPNLTPEIQRPNWDVGEYGNNWVLNWDFLKWKWVIWTEKLLNRTDFQTGKSYGLAEI